MGLTDLADEDPLFLGKGQRQRLAVASILAMQPDIIIVDEPTTGQDYRMVCGIMDLLQSSPAGQHSADYHARYDPRGQLLPAESWYC